MDELISVGLSNAVVACGLAVLAAGVGYCCRRPALRHALWLLVLLKLVTPPLIDVSVWRPVDPVSIAGRTPAPDSELLQAVPEAIPGFAEDVTPAPNGEDVPQEVIVETVPDPAADPVPALTEPAEKTPAVKPREWQPFLLAAWLGGSIAWLALAVLRAWRFGRLVRFARAAPVSLQREADGLARRLGLARAPAVRLLPGRVSPMLWAPGWAAQLLVPAELLDRLDAAGRRTLLTHELAHLRRRDHRVRLLELLVTALFWWHPVVWWARHELREAEEQCCDAWVLWALPAAAKTYALALVETVEFLCETRPPLPALASGMGHVQDLRRRVTMIMQGTTPRALTWSGLLVLLGVGVFLLPVRPTWAQDERRTPPATAPAAEDRTKAQVDLERLMAELQKKAAELRQLQAQVQEAQKRAAAAGANPAKGKDGFLILELVDGDKRQVIRLPADSRLQERPALRGSLDAVVRPPAPQPEGARRAAHTVRIEVISDGKRQVIELPAGSRVIRTEEAQPPIKLRTAVPENVNIQGNWEVVPVQPGQPAVVRPGTANPLTAEFIYKAVGKSPDLEKRVSDMEKKLDKLIRVVEEMQRSRSGPGGVQAPRDPNRPGGQPAPRDPDRQPPGR